MEIHLMRLQESYFNEESLDGFVRHQQIGECWRHTNSGWMLLPIAFEEDWDLNKRREVAADIAEHMGIDQSAFGAYDGDCLVGFVTISHHLFGQSAKYAELICLQVSEDYRRRGIGGKLFECACDEARLLGAERLYISSHSSKESQAAYKAFGCKLATEVNDELAAQEPFDVQLEYVL